jgi:hypothetical protein
VSEDEEIEAQSYKLILTNLCQHLASIAESLAGIDYQLQQLVGTTGSGSMERSYLRTMDIGD